MKRLVILAVGVVSLLVVTGCGPTETEKVSVTSSLETTASAVTSTVTETVTSSTPAPTTSLHYEGEAENADDQGFIGFAARCDQGDVALVIMRTEAAGGSGSRVVICYGGGDLYYRGMRDKQGDRGVTIRNVFRASNAYVAQASDGYSYVVKSDRLVISGPDNVVLSDEPAVEYVELKPAS